MTGTTTSFVAARNLTPPRTSPSSPPATSRFFEPPHCSPYRPTTTRVFCKAEMAILCEDCNGIGWLLCDFCKGQKTNVKSETNRIYLRCPSCRAIGQLCSKRKAFKCVTFPNYNDGEKVSI
ncbi:uncharacterized protein LOC103957508 isoform X2 [Pyrus x bretschneideri]|uniref:uncharacterized protein LOC103957508 isoform X2 n=1 Tax=Pyrus x bretschneideri TaxID=225117 RepID=UPI00202ECBEA|nr:uncharacterized protein LOC103957508 isoform X2 [Pyrus x bretschneideri]